MFSSSAIKSVVSLAVPFGVVYWVCRTESGLARQPTGPPTQSFKDTFKAAAIKFKVKAGGVASGGLKIFNQSPHDLRVRSFTSSCDCLTLHIPAGGLAVAAGETAVLNATLDLRRDPKNTNSFAPELQLFGDGIEPPILAKADVEVLPP